MATGEDRAGSAASGTPGPDDHRPQDTTDQIEGLLALAAEVRTGAVAVEKRLRELVPQETTASLKDRVVRLTGQVAVLQHRSTILTQRLDQARQRTEAARARSEILLGRSRELQEQLVTTRQVASERTEKLRESLVAARANLASKTALWTGARRYFPLFRQGLLYDEIAKSDVDLAADTYLCLLPSTAPAALALSRRHGGRVICDCVENVEVERHSLAPNHHPPALEMINLAAYGALTRVDGIMTVSESVARTLRGYGPPVRVQPNYRRFEEPAAAGKLRKRFGIDRDATVLITSGNIVEGFENLLDALSLLPPSVHLVALAKFSPASYAERVQQHIAGSDLAGRLHLADFVPYEELAGLLADADLGIITLDPSNPNHSVALPNRVFDFVTAGLPFVAPPLREISEFVQQHGCGATIPDVSPDAWARGIDQALRHLPQLRHGAVEARGTATWESLADGLVEFLGSPRTVTMLGFRDLTRYQRFLRVATTLAERGVRVNAVFFSEDPQPVDIPLASYYHFSDRYGLGPGLTRVGNTAS